MSPKRPLEELAITAWPDGEIGLPAYRRRRYRLDEAEGVLVGDVLDAPLAAPDGETYLRFAELDLDDDDAVIAFANAAGTVGMSGSPESQSLAEFRLTGQVARDAVTAWRLLQREPTLEAPQWELPRFAGAEEDAESLALEFLNVMLESGLEGLHPAVTVGREAPEAYDIPLYSLCCLELRNHVVGRVDYRRCANETCGRLFAPAGARRRDALYCSRACARAQAQREFRRRKREAS